MTAEDSHDYMMIDPDVMAKMAELYNRNSTSKP